MASITEPRKFQKIENGDCEAIFNRDLLDSGEKS